MYRLLLLLALTLCLIVTAQSGGSAPEESPEVSDYQVYSGTGADFNLSALEKLPVHHYLYRFRKLNPGRTGKFINNTQSPDRFGPADTPDFFYQLSRPFVGGQEVKMPGLFPGPIKRTKPQPDIING